MQTKLIAFLILTSSFLFEARADTATWSQTPTDNSWNNPANWDPMIVPGSGYSIARFGSSTITDITLNSVIGLGTSRFLGGADSYTITLPGAVGILYRGLGIANSSGVAQTFVLQMVDFNGPGITFSHGSTAGEKTFFEVNDTTIALFVDQSSAAGATFTISDSGIVDFFDDANAGHATFILTGGGPNTLGNGPLVQFVDRASAYNATFTLAGASIRGPLQSRAYFYGDASAANAVMTANGGTAAGADGAEIRFYDSSNAANSILIANNGVPRSGAGTIRFLDYSTGYTARIEVFDNGQLNIAEHNSPGVPIGSLEGTGLVSLGANNLTVGSNTLDTSFAGVIRDDGSNGSLTKTGPGTLTLAGSNTYTGGTTVEQGVLLVSNQRDSGTGSGPVEVSGVGGLEGRLGGTGSIAGSVEIGTSGPGTLAPGKGASIGRLVIRQELLLHSAATYVSDLDSNSFATDQVTCNGLAIDNGAGITINDLGSSTLSTGTTLVLIRNTASTPISGTFANLPDGGTIAVGSNTFQANYEGGDGNDMTLTVVP